MFVLFFNKFSSKPPLICKNHNAFVQLNNLKSQRFIFKNQNMSHNPNLLKPPEHVAGLTILNKSLFEKTVTLPCLVIKDLKVSAVLPHVKKFLLKLDNFKPVRNISENEAHIYLNPETVTKWDDLNAEQTPLTENCLQMKTYTLTYDNFSLESVLRAVLPPRIEGMSSFTKMGHIVHVNLREHLLPYKDLIGQVLYEKVPNCRTVVNKVAEIDNTYRNFNMEVLRGENDMLTSVKENKCVFEFDFSKVYWNSRLCTEHERIVTMIKSDDVVFDVFAGVGPFSVPLAKKKCRVFANDLNPESFKWLNHNCKKNKIDLQYFRSYNKDGRDFIVSDIKSLLPQFLNKKIYILMNLPALAVEFLSSFVGLYDEKELAEITDPPVVVVYCFAKGEDYNQIAKNLLFENVGWDIGDKIIDLFRVVMGKNKHKKNNSVFKVAGAKSLKLKAKAKVVKTELKQINIKNKSKIVEMDKELMNLQDKIRSTSEKKEPPVKKHGKLPSRDDTNSDAAQQKSQETLNQLEAMQL